MKTAQLAASYFIGLGPSRDGPIEFDWGEFKVWLSGVYGRKTAVDVFSYARRFGFCLLTGDLRPLLGLSESKRLHALKALSALAKFIGVHERFRELVKNYGFKWGKCSDELIIRRITGKNGDDILDWVGVVSKVHGLSLFSRFMLVSGLRFEEAINAYNLIIDGVSGYFNRELSALEHFRFKEIFTDASCCYNILYRKRSLA
ncbi:MAG: hypothetical protein QXK89_09530 [Candidatus Bathyarchaeia archaeon]